MAAWAGEDRGEPGGWAERGFTRDALADGRLAPWEQSRPCLAASTLDLVQSLQFKPPKSGGSSCTLRLGRCRVSGTEVRTSILNSRS